MLFSLQLKTQASGILNNCEPRGSKISTLTVQLGNKGGLGAFSDLPRCLYSLCCINHNTFGLSVLYFHSKVHFQLKRSEVCVPSDDNPSAFVLETCNMKHAYMILIVSVPKYYLPLFKNLFIGN